MAEAATDEKSLAGRFWEFAKERAQAIPGEIGQAVAAEAQRAAADIGSTYQACLWNGWHTQSAAVESPEQISEQLAKDQENKKLEAEKSSPMVGLEKD